MTTQNQKVSKILIAPDKFKGSLTSSQAAMAIKRGIEEKFLLPDGRMYPEIVESGACAVEEGNSRVHLQFRMVEIADGGDGSLEVLQKKIPGATLSDIKVHDPLGRCVQSQILLYRTPGAENEADFRSGNENIVVRAENDAEIRSENGKDGFGAENEADFRSGDENIAVRAEKDAEIRSENGKDGFGAEKGSDFRSGNENIAVRAENDAEIRSEGGGLCAFIEMAKVSGLEMLTKGERNPLYTSTYGLGEAIREAVANGATQITLSIGGSATNDGGSGMLQALGYSFYDGAGNEMASPICGGDLIRVAAVGAPKGSDADVLSGIEFKVICDVTNPLVGEQGATAVYGPQKGADGEALEVLEAGLLNYAAVAEKCLGVSSEMKMYPGAGAAGGVGYAGLAFLGAELVPGWKFFALITSLEESVQWADLVITGEGSLDSQSLNGKVVSGVINFAARYNKEVAIFCGISKLAPADMEAISQMLPKGVACHSIASLGHPLDVCMSHAAELLQQLACSAVYAL